MPHTYELYNTDRVYKRVQRVSCPGRTCDAHCKPCSVRRRRRRRVVESNLLRKAPPLPSLPADKCVDPFLMSYLDILPHRLHSQWMQVAAVTRPKADFDHFNSIFPSPSHCSTTYPIHYFPSSPFPPSYLAPSPPTPPTPPRPAAHSGPSHQPPVHHALFCAYRPEC